MNTLFLVIQEDTFKNRKKIKTVLKEVFSNKILFEIDHINKSYFIKNYDNFNRLTYYKDNQDEIFYNYISNLSYKSIKNNNIFIDKYFNKDKILSKLIFKENDIHKVYNFHYDNNKRLIEKYEHDIKLKQSKLLFRKEYLNNSIITYIDNNKFYMKDYDDFNRLIEIKCNYDNSRDIQFDYLDYDINNNLKVKKINNINDDYIVFNKKNNRIIYEEYFKNTIINYKFFRTYDEKYVNHYISYRKCYNRNKLNKLNKKELAYELLFDPITHKQIEENWYDHVSNHLKDIKNMNYVNKYILDNFINI